MPLFETESIVLKSYSLAEADRIVVFYTRDHGMVRGVAKGAKRLKSRFGSTLEPFSIVNLEYFLKEDRELVSIQRVDLVRSAFDIASEPSFLQAFSYLADLLTAIAPPHDPNETLYRMVRACLESKVTSAEDLAAISLYFEVWLLRLGGFLPDWSTCSRCRRSLAEFETADLDAEFEILCGECSRGRGIQKVPPTYRHAVRDALRMPPPGFIEAGRERREVIAELSGIFKRLITRAIGTDRPVERAFTLRAK
ncbi:MAG: DNA repair protein RecO [Pyrinomonadaceae bacterium]|nr:DNA repair protein RecO [Pyrinomonadaceae bacterium]